MAQLTNFRVTEGGLIADLVDDGRVIEVAHLTERLRSGESYANAIELFRTCEVVRAPDETDPRKRRELLEWTLRNRVVWLDESGTLRFYSEPMAPGDVDRVARYYATLPGFRVLNVLPIDQADELWQRGVENERRGRR